MHEELQRQSSVSASILDYLHVLPLLAGLSPLHPTRLEASQRGHQNAKVVTPISNSAVWPREYYRYHGKTCPQVGISGKLWWRSRLLLPHMDLATMYMYEQVSRRIPTVSCWPSLGTLRKICSIRNSLVCPQYRLSETVRCFHHNEPSPQLVSRGRS